MEESRRGPLNSIMITVKPSPKSPPDGRTRARARQPQLRWTAADPHRVPELAHAVITPDRDADISAEWSTAPGSPPASQGQSNRFYRLANIKDVAECHRIADGRGRHRFCVEDAKEGRQWPEARPDLHLPHLISTLAGQVGTPSRLADPAGQAYRAKGPAQMEAHRVG